MKTPSPAPVGAGHKIGSPLRRWLSRHLLAVLAVVAGVGSVCVILGAATSAGLLWGPGLLLLLAAGYAGAWWRLRRLDERHRWLQGVADQQGRALTKITEQLAGQTRDLGSLERMMSSLAEQSNATDGQLRELSTQLDVRSKEVYLRVRDTHLGLLRKVERLPGLLLTEQQAATQLLQSYSPRAPLPIIAGWAMAPSGLLWIVDFIERTKPQLVVECGSGTTTLWIALALERTGSGRVVSLEHSAEFCSRTTKLLAQHGVADRAEVRTTPLKDTLTSRGTQPWYDVAVDTLGTIDLLVVDGPPGSTGPLARYPALPVLGGLLGPGATVVVDDVDRADEQEIVRQWMADDPRLRQEADLDGQIAVLTLD